MVAQKVLMKSYHAPLFLLLINLLFFRNNTFTTCYGKKMSQPKDVLETIKIDDIIEDFKK